MKNILLLFCLISFSGFSQTVQDWTIKSKENQADRSQILDVARAEVKKDIKQEVIFQVTYLKTAGNYAWFQANVLAKNGGELKMPNDFYDCCHVEGLFEKVNGVWKVVEFVGFSTDVWYWGIAEKYPKAPKSIFNEAALGEEVH